MKVMVWCMAVRILILAIVCTMFSFSAAGMLHAEEPAEGFGPFPTRNFSPVKNLFLGMPAERATTLRKGTTQVRVESAQSNSVFDEHTVDSSSVVKMEQNRTALDLRYGMTDTLEAGFEIPLLSRTEGFLEPFIEAIEAVTIDGGERNRLEDVPFAYQIERKGQTLFSGSDGQVGLGDISLYAKREVAEEGDWLPKTSLRVALKIPTGSERRSFGSGTFDIGVGIAGEKRPFPWWIMYVNVNGVFPTARISGLKTLPSLSAVFSNEFLLLDRFSIGAQFNSYTSHVTGAGLSSVDKGANEVAGGFTYAFKNNMRAQLYGIEGIDSPRGGEADFTLSLVLTYLFGSDS